MEDKDHNYILDEDLAAFLDGNVSEDEMSRILSSLDGNPEVAEILTFSPEIDKSYRKRRIACSQCGHLQLPIRKTF